MSGAAPGGLQMLACMVDGLFVC